MSAFQGFDIKLNIRESISDRDVLNNLGGEPIADDIVKFLNNLRNKSILDVKAGNISGSSINFTGEKEFVFTNGTELTIGNNTSYVGNSNGVDNFRLYSDSNLTQLITNPPIGIYERSDTVSINDILKLVPFRDIVVEDLSISVFESRSGSNVFIDSNVYNSIIDVYRLFTDDTPGTLAGFLSSIDIGIDFFDMRKNKSINNITNFSTENKVTLNGSIVVLDPAGTNNVNMTSTSGIFILDSSTGNSTRIFSTNDNVWSASGSDLIGDTREILVGNLVFNEGVRLLRKSSSPPITIETQIITNFTHFSKIMVNGEEYQICLK
jgi:hypothetical protein